MKSTTTPAFRADVRRLPAHVARHAHTAYELWKAQPFHPDLHFKKVAGSRNLYSVRIGDQWRALARRRDDLVVWFWIGSHAEYDKLLRRL